MCHPHSSNDGAKGYLGNLAEAQTAALAALRARVSDGQQQGLLDISSITLSCDGYGESEDLDRCLLRYLRAHGFDVERTLVILGENVAWRAQEGTAALRAQTPAEVLGVPAAELRALIAARYPHWLLGDDRRGRPVLLYRYGAFDARALLRRTTARRLQRYHVWEQEQNARLLARRARRRRGGGDGSGSGGGAGGASGGSGCDMDAYSLILDLQGLGVGQITSELVALLRYIAETDARHYPRRCATTYVVNTPPLFGVIWGAIRGCLEGSSADLRVLSDRKRWQQVRCALVISLAAL
ncbi:CRAL-TRIO domain-containing protein [Tribonema minus]|uniref:CRAL-TRIO domain-containing protein n=1 Tax=Tribonema minus TaxID=303371 RepID=A0A835ZHE9_9STRA|nr:CRAL-TRIO domain-containing protein [Tribonema minus]